jgi:GNAT superfamily N-acetyltransferase
MAVSAILVTHKELEPWRALYRQEMNCQILHDSFFRRPGWTQSYLLRFGARAAGYGAYVQAGPWAGTRTIFEVYLAPRYRDRAFEAFAGLRRAGGANGMRAQTNDILTSAMLLAHGRNIETEKVVFHDALTTRHALTGAAFRRVNAQESAALAARGGEGALGDWAVEIGGRTAGTGGILWHYNRPYGDLYMEVAPDFRRRGVGRFLVQELKAQCYQEGGIPCARCDPSNVGSVRTLQAAGFAPCACLVTASLGPLP